MKKILVLTACLSLLSFGAFAKTFKLVSEAYPPYEYQENGKNIGMDVEILDLITKKTGVEIKIEFIPWKRALEMVKDGSADGIFSLAKTPEREEFLHYPGTPLYQGKTVLFAHPDYKGDPKSLEDLKGKTVSIVTDNSYGAEFDGNKEIQKDASSDQDTQMRKLIAGRVPLTVANEIVGWHNIKKQGGKDIRTLGIVVDKDVNYIGVSKKSPNSKEFL